MDFYIYIINNIDREYKYTAILIVIYRELSILILELISILVL